MDLHRREFLSTAAAAGATLVQGTRKAAPPRTIKAVAFDAFPILDPRPIFALTEELFPGRGTDLSSQWRTRQFEYTWLRTIAGRYVDFWRVTEDALRFAAKAISVQVSPAQEGKLMNAYLQLKPWPDVKPVIQKLKAAGLRIGFLSNFTPKMLEASLTSAQLDGSMDFALSTDAAKTYKPDPKAYQLAMDHLGLKREEILFVAFAGWDAAGAKLFGYPTYWVNRLKLPAEELGTSADGTDHTLAALPKFLGLS
jgi:2-haloacid dehalogenase